MGRQSYYTLLASLPPLLRFERAQRLPISRERLQQRFRMLTPDDSRWLARSAPFLTWQKGIPNLTTQEMVVRLKRLVEVISNSILKTLFEFPVDQRTIMAALRRRHRGLGPPTAHEPWGLGRYVMHIERNWENPYFRLAAVYPWISEAQLHLESEEVLALDRLLKKVLWDHLDRTVPPYDFGFPAVVCYRMKWDMLDQWLTHDANKAGKRFEELVNEITDGQPKLFH